ncbi:UDP-N-acetylmuramoyl-L-alanine--D-glutamate ligase [Asanoa sp. WMMD1127]|uniref:UDP-N-acetylmuramoyl-L-alanine--D-glutamate ligase n=1 Tax=Asanoa sp. WMMD1127 TaxID=3016107 RepID=UPI0024175A44|nr:UDP-N-acetylmuramoyl-L-alanine--D-glutamate ligase [Asanoa sp. WMMD1127]MDG4826715.1 UDP-N-acetylmuramoyl-L-alanine--D-glutamate ligase [Asanoa sp. WMMD1127]
MRLADLQGRRVAVWGTGREGRAAVLAVAARQPASLVAVDDGGNFLSLPWEGELAAAAPLTDRYEALAEADVVVRSPGVPQTHPWMVKLREQGVPVTQGTALWMADRADRTVGVTGSKGKSTTSSLVSHLLTAVGRPNVYGGNIGVPVLDLPADADQYVLELSSYQCSDLTDSPRVAAITALFPEHLDAHGGEEEYYRDKLNLIAHGPKAIIYNGADAGLAARLRDQPGATAANVDGGFRIAGDDVLAPDGTRLFARTALNLTGRHNAGNLCVALAVLTALGVDCVAHATELEAAARGFQPLPHRLAEIVDPTGLTFVDDTLATSPHATMHAIDAYDGRPLTVIVGGTDRGLDYTAFRDYLEAHGPITVLGIPDSGARMVDALKGLDHVHAEVVDDLVTAVHRARAVTPADGVVLLSPGAPSYGKFRNFEHRSAAYAEAIKDSAPA